MKKRTGFTLVELLVVIAIIGMLAALLMPSLIQALDAGRKAQCFDNMHNAGVAINMYLTNNNSYYPADYCYIDGWDSTGGYHHWTAEMQPGDFTAPVTAGEYPHTSDNYVCPSHLCQGFAPTNFTSTRIPTPPFGQVAQSSTFDDQQVARLSYVANECLMPRKKFSAAFDTANPPGTSNLCLVNQAEVDNIQGTIFLAEFSNSCNCIFGSFSGGGSTCKSQRPTNGVLNTAQANSVFNGEIYSSGSPDTIYKLTYGEAMNAINAVLASPTAAASQHHISCIDPNTHGASGSNYAFADGHVKTLTLDVTLDNADFMWGRKMYSCTDKPIIQDNNGE